METVEIKSRIADLKGKFVVACNQRDGKKILYVQDKEYGDGYWTAFISNARGFHNMSDAMGNCNIHKNGMPRVYKVIGNGRLELVYTAECGLYNGGNRNE